jgi:heme-degrading monooxygenase HmoA
MMVAVFRARRTEAGDGEEYYFQLQRMSELARKMPGYISHKPYVAEDGERLTLFEWESPETLRAWANHPEHVPVKELGRQRFYTEYRLQVCEVVRESKFTRQAEAARESG